MNQNNSFRAGVNFHKCSLLHLIVCPAHCPHETKTYSCLKNISDFIDRNQIKLFLKFLVRSSKKLHRIQEGMKHIKSGGKGNLGDHSLSTAAIITC